MALSFGYARTEVLAPNSGPGLPAIASGVTNGGQLQLLGGFAVEHTLLQQLSVRINVRVVGAGFNAGRSPALAAAFTTATTRNSGFDVSIGVSPGIELRLYF